MLGVGDAISPDFCLTIPRHWARSLAARGIEPLGRTCNEKYLVRSEENYLEDGGAVSSVLIKRLVSNVSASLESVEVRRQQQCPDKCRILSELSGVGFFNFHQYCACYSTFFLFVIVILYM